MLIDTHAHLNFEAYDDDRDKVIKRCEDRKMKVINVGAQFATSRIAVQIADDYENMYAAVGLHPIHVFDEDFNLDDYQHLIDNCSKVVAIGETGLDFFHPTFNRPGAEARSLDEVLAKQKEVFLNQIKLAKKNNLPLILHGRNSSAPPADSASPFGAGSATQKESFLKDKDVYKEMLEILKAEKVERAVFHCFGGDLQTAEIIIDRGFYIGADGPLTFKKKAKELQAIIAKLPLEKILIETDCPYLTPEPHRGDRNEPVYVEQVAEKIAELKNLSPAEVIERTWQNAKDLFGL